MIENIRKYKGLIIVAIALVAVALVVGMQDDSFRNAASGSPVIKIAGRTYDDNEFHSLGSGSLQLATSLAQGGDFGLYQFVMSLSTGATSKDNAAEKFFVNRILLRRGKEEFGIFPDENEVSDYIRTMRAFSNPEGEFVEENYRNFIEKGIGRLGMTEKDLRELVTDVLVSKKLNSIIGSGLGVSRDIAAQNLALDSQQIAGSVARLDIAAFEADINPTDEEIKEYWETLQDAFTTEPLRKFTYLIGTPDMPEEPKAEEHKETIADAAASDEQKQKKAAEKAAAETKRAAEHAEARRKKQIELDSMVDDFSYELEENEGNGFEELAAENKWEVVTTELFAQSTPPKDLDVDLRASSRGGKAVDELFRIEITSDPVSKISQPIAIGENQWLMARLDGEEDSRIKTFEEARDEARVQYIKEKAEEALKAAAEKARDEIKAALAAGKSFADAAKDAGIAETKDVSKVTSTYRPDPIDEPATLFQNGRDTDPGTLADLIIEPKRAFVFYVEKREVIKQADVATRVDSALTSGANQNELIAFTGWITGQAEAAKVEQLYRK